jgi:hypothetical protein
LRVGRSRLQLQVTVRLVLSARSVHMSTGVDVCGCVVTAALSRSRMALPSAGPSVAVSSFLASIKDPPLQPPP